METYTRLSLWDLQDCILAAGFLQGAAVFAAIAVDDTMVGRYCGGVVGGCCGIGALDFGEERVAGEI